MIQRFVDDFRARAEEAIANIQGSMGRGGCANMKAYKAQVGEIKGWKAAITLADELRVKLGEDEDG